METMLKNFKIELIKVSDEFEFIYKCKSAGKIISLSSILHAVIIVLSFPFGMYSSTQLYDQKISLFDSRILDQQLGTKN